MVRRILAVLGVGLAVALASAGSAGALAVGLGVTTVPVLTPVPVPPVVDSVVGGAENVVPGAVLPANPPPSEVFAGTPDLPADGVSTGDYQAFENLVNDVQDGGGSPAPLLSGDAFSPQGVDGGVAGVPMFAPARLLK